MTIRNLISLLPFAAYLQGCVSMRDLAAKGTSSLAPLGEISMRQESNLAAFRIGVPAGLQMLEASLLAQPGNISLLASLAKGYNGYAVAVAETDRLAENLTNSGSNNARDLAVSYHTRAVEKARAFFLAKGIKWSNKADQTAEQIRALSGDQTVTDLAYVTAHSLKSLIALQKGKAAVLTYLPLANALTAISCEGKIKPSYPAWACDVMMAVEFAEKPTVAGGDINKAKATFMDIIKKHPDELMPKAIMAEFLFTKQNNPTEWQHVKAANIDYKVRLFERQQKIAFDAVLPVNDSNALLNAAASQRIETMAAHEKDFF